MTGCVLLWREITPLLKKMVSNTYVETIPLLPLTDSCRKNIRVDKQYTTSTAIKRNLE